MMNKVIFKVIAEIRRWEIHLDTDIRKTALNEFYRRHEVAIGTDESHNICCVHHTILNHADRDINVGFLFFRSRNVAFAVRADDVLFKIFASDNLKEVAIYELVAFRKALCLLFF